MDAQKVVIGIAGFIAALVIFGVFATMLGGETAVPKYEGTTGANQAALTTACDALDNGYWDFTPGTFSSANQALSETNCPASQQFTGVVSILNLLPLIMVGGAVAFGGYIFYRRRYA